MLLFSKYIGTSMVMAIISGCSSDRVTSSEGKLELGLASAPAALPFSSGTLTVPDAGPGDPQAAQAALADPDVLATLRGLALHFSSLSGVPSPKTMQVVAASDHQAAETILSGAVVNDHAPVHVIKMTGGPFTAKLHPPGAQAPQGNVLTITVDARTHRVTDVGYVNVEPNLSQIGPVVVNLAQ